MWENSPNFPVSFKSSKLQSEPTLNRRFVRLLKIIKARKSISKQVAKQSMNSIELERMLLFLFIFGILCHSLTCLWFLVAKLQDFDPLTWVVRYDYMEADSA